ncbi:GNAT family N-acetyltransferase [Hankyongella ginsenosidimutans]|uniref:GNAT family N-acetyltransferase n=1 Tax=Hankyongella ginsenosidimutans TaxID=1763828 RepID=UPI001FE8B9AF|nr:GNAT family N-acetyltransferase [Hankyongella ginsenosidimutans]
MHFFYFGGTREGREWAVNDFLFWSVLEAARTRGLKLFDMGRSKVGTGSYDFKVNWESPRNRWPMSSIWHPARTCRI